MYSDVNKTFLSRPRPRLWVSRPRLYFSSSRRLDTKTLVSRTTSLHIYQVNFSVHRILCLALFSLITQAQLAAGSHIFIGCWYIDKIALLTYKSLLTNQPPYLKNLHLHCTNHHAAFTQQVRIFYVFLPALLSSVDVLSVFFHSYNLERSTGHYQGVQHIGYL